MANTKRLFVILWLAGFAGVLSFLLLDIGRLIEVLPLPAGAEVPDMSPMTIKLLGLIQPAVILSGAVLIGVGLARKVGLSSPAAEALSVKGDWLGALRPQFLPGILGGIAGGLAIIATAAAAKPYLPAETVELIGKFSQIMPVLMRFLYGGITEELLLRWGFMTLIVWALWRLIQKGEGRARAPIFVAAIIISSLAFGIGHLPIAFLLVPEPTPALILFVIVANSVFGLIAGSLYWKKGLESAMIAHITAHVVMLAASSLGAYF